MAQLATKKDGVRRLVGRLTMEKKKCIVAVCLIAVMVFMWVRVLTGSQPDSAAAGSRFSGQADSSVGKLESQPKIFPLQLPKVKGRNDVLSNNFFKVADWQSFVGAGGYSSVGLEQVSVKSETEKQRLRKKLAEQLKLEAIKMGPSPRAFINDKLLGVGDRLSVSDGEAGYEYEVMGFDENRVFLKCEDVEVVLRLADKM
jgi:hypothetical protein